MILGRSKPVVLRRNQRCIFLRDNFLVSIFFLYSLRLLQDGLLSQGQIFGLKLLLGLWLLFGVFHLVGQSFPGFFLDQRLQAFPGLRFNSLSGQLAAASLVLRFPVFP